MNTLRASQTDWFHYLVVGLLSVAGILSLRSVHSEDDSTGLQFGPARKRSELANELIVESSGVAISRCRPGAFWTHNDSGDQPRLFAFDSEGRDLGICRVSHAEAIDWEDISSYQRDGKNWLLVADVGDNGRLRKSYELYTLEEPTPGASAVTARKRSFRYEDGPHNCESVAVDTSSGAIFLCTKAIGTTSQVFELPLSEDSGDESQIARKIASVPIPIAVGMDISSDGLQAVILTYGDAFWFQRSPTETWREAFSRTPRRLKMPSRAQGESICFGSSNNVLYLTSEKRPTPLWEVPLDPIQNNSPQK